jgi:RIO kinase 1
LSHDLTDASSVLQPDAYHHSPDDPRLAGIDERFVFDFQSYDDIDESTQRWSTWLSVEPLCRGPEPRPDWVVTSQGAVDTELGILKTGKEADVFLLERADPAEPERGVIMAAKRYRDTDHRNFHRSATYTEGRSMKRSRDQRAVKAKSTWGKVMASGQWVASEWEALKRCWALGLPVPYPVQVDGTEILMEWITVDGDTAPRLAQTRPEPELLRHYFEQLREATATMVQAGIVHGDLSAYNILAAGDRLVIIDLPQIVDLVGNPQGMDYLLRDLTNICGWFRSKGLEVDEHDVFADMLSTAF